MTRHPRCAMPIPVVCACTAKLKVGDHLEGKHIKCPRCGTLLAVGAPNGSAPAAPAPRPEPALPSTEEVLRRSDLLDKEREALLHELGRDERLLWAGKPSARVAFLRGWLIAAGLYSGAVMFLIMLLAMNAAGAFGHGGGWLILLFALLIVALVVAGTVIPFGTRWYKRLTAYAVTTRRALAWVPDWFGKVKHVRYDPTDLVKLYRKDIAKSEGGVGDLIFGAFTRDRKTKEGIVRT